MDQSKHNQKRSQADATDTDEGSLPEKKNALEWVVFSVGLILVLGILSYLVYQTVTYKSGTPDLSVGFVKDPSAHNLNRYRIIITNKGGETAEEVKIEATLQRADSVSETAELGVAFSPKQSEREGWVNFSSAPSANDSVSVRVVSYQSP